MGAKPLKTVGDFDRDEIHELAMAKIEHDPARFQTRAEIDMEVVNAWVKAVRLFQSTGGKEGSPLTAWPPVLVKELPDGRLFLADGFHRWDLYRKLGRKSIRAIIEPGEDDGDVLLRGIKANLDNLKFRAVTEKDRVHSVEMMIRNEEFRTWGDRLLARICGVKSERVKKIRNRLCDQEGIALPDRIKVFRRDGTWSGIWKPYRQQQRGIPAISVGRVGRNRKHLQHTARVDGETISLGSDAERAEIKLAGLLDARREIKASLSDTYSFIVWLNNHGVAASGENTAGCIVGGILVADAVLFQVSDETFSSMLQSIGKCLIYRKVGGAARRLILVGYPSRAISQVIKYLSNQPVPIELLTPEQVVAEFGPRPDGPTAPAGQPKEGPTP
jgi:hypothetical protein